MKHFDQKLIIKLDMKLDQFLRAKISIIIANGIAENLRFDLGAINSRLNSKTIEALKKDLNEKT